MSAHFVPDLPNICPQPIIQVPRLCTKNPDIPMKCHFDRDIAASSRCVTEKPLYLQQRCALSLPKGTSLFTLLSRLF
jgi:hypothetical protein